VADSDENVTQLAERHQAGLISGRRFGRALKQLSAPQLAWLATDLYAHLSNVTTPLRGPANANNERDRS
jgi:hypothetical protein